MIIFKLLIAIEAFAGYWAQIESGVVKSVIVADADFIATMPGKWVETSKKGNPKKRSHAVVGGLYREDLDAFVDPQPHRSWKLDEKELKWKAPKPRPDDEHWWNEATGEWEKNLPKK